MYHKCSLIYLGQHKYNNNICYVWTYIIYQNNFMKLSIHKCNINVGLYMLTNINVISCTLHELTMS